MEQTQHRPEGEDAGAATLPHKCWAQHPQSPWDSEVLSPPVTWTCPPIDPAIAKSSSPGIRSWIQTFPVCDLFQCFRLSGVQGHPVLNLPSPTPRGHLLGRRPLRLTRPWRAAFPSLQHPKHALAPTKQSQFAAEPGARKGKPQLPFPLQKLCEIFRPWKHFLPTQGIFRLMVHQTSQSRKP